MQNPIEITRSDNRQQPTAASAGIEYLARGLDLAMALDAPRNAVRPAPEHVRPPVPAGDGIEYLARGLAELPTYFAKARGRCRDITTARTRRPALA